MNNKTPLFLREEMRYTHGHDGEIICRCGKEFHDLESLIISLDDAGLTFYCDHCPENIFRVRQTQFDLPYV